MQQKNNLKHEVVPECGTILNIPKMKTRLRQFDTVNIITAHSIRLPMISQGPPETTSQLPCDKINIAKFVLDIIIFRNEPWKICSTFCQWFPKFPVSLISLVIGLKLYTNWHYTVNPRNLLTFPYRNTYFPTIYALWGNSFDHISYDHTRSRTSATVSSDRVQLWRWYAALYCLVCTQCRGVISPSLHVMLC